MAAKTEIFTATLTSVNTGFTITENDGISNLSIYNSSTVAATIIGTKKIGATASSAISIGEGVTVTFSTIGYAMDDVVLTIPANCTLAVIAS